jgi:hypothetical protein
MLPWQHHETGWILLAVLQNVVLGVAEIGFYEQGGKVGCMGDLFTGPCLFIGLLDVALGFHLLIGVNLKKQHYLLVWIISNLVLVGLKTMHVAFVLGIVALVPNINDCCSVTNATIGNVVWHDVDGQQFHRDLNSPELCREMKTAVPVPAEDAVV